MSLANLLARQQQHLSTLLELLAEEQNSLVAGVPDGESLAELARQKQTELAAISDLEAKRAGAQRALGYSNDLQGAERAATEAHCLQQWQALQDTAQRVAHLNRLNGSLIERLMEHNQQALTLLRELTQEFLYGEDGQRGRFAGRINSSA